MKRKPAALQQGLFPKTLHPVLSNHRLYDSSCSREAAVWFLEGTENLFLKSASAGSLKAEAEMTRYFHGKGLGPEVLDYHSGEKDWLLTRAVPGEDCTFPKYLEDPKRLCDTTATLLRRLHEQSHAGCPVTNHRDLYLTQVHRNRRAGICDLSLFPEKDWGFSSPEEAWSVVTEYEFLLQQDTLLHGDYCLPNVVLDNWKFTGFIDVGRGGVGDRHTDIFWGVWTLFFNLKTNAFCNRFLDAYGRDRIQPETLRLIAACEVFL